MILKISLVILTLLTSFLGGISNQFTDWIWYENLTKATLNPPNYIFGIVWPVLYLLMAIVSFLNARLIYKLFIIQLALNASWSWIFFVLQQPEIAIVDVLLLIGINFKILKRLYKKRLFISAVMYFPYIIWLCFAAYLNISISILN